MNRPAATQHIRPTDAADQPAELRRLAVMGLCDLPSGEGAARRDPRMRLAGRRCDMLEVRVVVENHCAMVLGHRSGQQVDHAGGPVVTPGRHPDLDIPCPACDHLADRQDNVEFLAALGDRAHIAKIAAGVAGLQVNRDARGSRAIDDETGDDGTDHRMLAPDVRRSVDHVELPGSCAPRRAHPARLGLDIVVRRITGHVIQRTRGHQLIDRPGPLPHLLGLVLGSRDGHRRAVRMMSGSLMSGPTPRACGSSSSRSIRRRRLATNSSAALTVSFFVVVPSSLAARSSASSFRSIMVFIYLILLLRIYRWQHGLGRRWGGAGAARPAPGRLKPCMVRTTVHPRPQPCRSAHRWAERYQHANREVLVEGDPLALRLRGSRGKIPSRAAERGRHCPGSDLVRDLQMDWRIGGLRWEGRAFRQAGVPCGGSARRSTPSTMSWAEWGRTVPPATPAE